MKIVIRNHKKDNLVTNIRWNYAFVLVLSFLCNLGNSNTLRFCECVICLMSLNSRSFLKKKETKKKQWCKGPKTDEKVASLNVEVHAKTFAYQIFVFFNATVC